MKITHIHPEYIDGQERLRRLAELKSACGALASGEKAD